MLFSLAFRGVEIEGAEKWEAGGCRCVEILALAGRDGGAEPGGTVPARASHVKSIPRHERYLSGRWACSRDQSTDDRIQLVLPRVLPGSCFPE
jgi:hypothetical protein